MKLDCDFIIFVSQGFEYFYKNPSCRTWDSFLAYQIYAVARASEQTKKNVIETNRDSIRQSPFYAYQNPGIFKAFRTRTNWEDRFPLFVGPRFHNTGHRFHYKTLHTIPCRTRITFQVQKYKHALVQGRPLNYLAVDVSLSKKNLLTTAVWLR